MISFNKVKLQRDYIDCIDMYIIILLLIDNLIII